MLRRGSTRRALVQFFRQFSVLAAAGIALDRGLEICGQQTSDRVVRRKARVLAQELRHGVRLSDAIGRVGAPFTSLHAGVVLAAENSGRYDAAFAQLAVWEEKADGIESRIRSLMSYPILVCVVAAVGTLTLLRFLAPLIRSVQDQLGGEPSLPTRVVLFAGTISANPFVVAGALAALALLIWMVPRLARNALVRAWWERGSLRLPVVGSLLRKAWMVRVARSLHSLLAAGLPMVRCIELCAEATGNGYLGRYVLRDAAFGVLKGETLSQALPASVLSRAFVGMLAVGETSGNLPEMLDRVADLHEIELGAEIEALFRATEPIIMGVVGLIVLICLLCAFQPLYTLVMRL